MLGRIQCSTMVEELSLISQIGKCSPKSDKWSLEYGQIICFPNRLQDSYQTMSKPWYQTIVNKIFQVYELVSRGGTAERRKTHYYELVITFGFGKSISGGPSHYQPTYCYCMTIYSTFSDLWKFYGSQCVFLCEMILYFQIDSNVPLWVGSAVHN